MKITIISDVHIGNYPNYETFQYERLLWYKNYAKEVIEESRKQSSRYLFIAGDLSDRSTNPPQIQNVIREVINLFDAYFTKIFYINGQHDLKTQNYDYIDNDSQSALHAMSTNKMEYGDHRIINLGGRSIAMMDFNPDPDLSWIEGTVDLFIGHVTINTSGFGSEIDYDKFTIGIAGDIHYPCHKNNLHSVGVGVPRYLGDAQDGTYVICDLDDLSWERVQVDPDHHWLTRYCKTHNESEEGPSDEKLDNGISPKFYKIYYPEITSQESGKVLVFDDSRVSSINEIISETIKINDLEEIHGKVLNLNQQISSVDLNFKLLSLAIHNIRSIEDHTINFSDKSGTLQICAENGGGKSAIIWSLNYALRGGLDIRNEIREGCEDASVYLTLEYQNKIYGIYRDLNSVSLDIDGQWQALGNKRETEAGIIEHLPFIAYIDSYFFADDSTRILGSYSAERRIELLSTYYRLDVLDVYHNTAQELVQSHYDEAGDLWSKYEELVQAKDLRESQILEEKEKIKDYPSREVLEASINEYETLYKEAIIRESKLESFDEISARRKVQSLDREISSLTSSRDLKRSTLKKLEETFKSLLKGTHHDKEFLDEEYDELHSQNVKLQVQHQQLTHQKKLIEDYDNLKKIICPECSKVITLMDFNPITKEDLQKEYEELSTAYDIAATDYQKKLESYQRKNSEEEDYQEYLETESKIQNLKDSIDLLDDNITSRSKESNDLKDKISTNEKLKSEGISSESYKETLDQYRKQLSALDNLANLEKEFADKDFDTHIRKTKSEYDNLCELCQKYELYLQLFSHDGELFKLVLKSIVSKFSSSNFKYDVVTCTYRGREYNDIVGYYKNYKMKDYREYSHCSNGQKTLLDLDFIKNLVTSAGVVVFDDFLGYLTTENLIEGLHIIHDMKPNLRIITSQNENTLYVDNSIVLSYNGDTTEFIKE